MRREFAVFAALNRQSRVDALSRQPAADEENRARLAAALRENLKRRKAQARARLAGQGPELDRDRPDTAPLRKAVVPRP